MRAKIRNGFGATCLSLLAFTCLVGASSAQAAAPTVETKAATHITATHAQLHGSVDPESESTVYWFQYGPADCASNPCTAVPADEGGAVLGTGTEALFISQVALGLQPETTYHFRLLAKNGSGTTPGADETLTTPPAPGSAATCANAALRTEQHATFLPDCRAYELVSPPDKNGANVTPDTQRTRAAADGSALGFTSLGAFAGAVGTGVATDYLSTRSTSGPGPATTGWSTHAITPAQQSLTLPGLFALLEPMYLSEFTPDLGAGVFGAVTPLTADPDVAAVNNLYLRTDLRSPGAGSYRLLTACPRCREIDEAEGPGEGALPAPAGPKAAGEQRPFVAAISADATRAAFESRYRLTKDTPSFANPELFEWDDGVVRLAGRIPAGGAGECDDSPPGPACKSNGAEASFAGQGVGVARNGNGNGATQRFPHGLSDGSDGHSRLFFTRPTQPTSTSINLNSEAGQLFLREDGHRTIQLNASERETADPYQAAAYWDASPDGTRAFFSTRQALTDDAPTDGAPKLYMWSLAPVDGEEHHLTYIADGGGVIGEGGDGHYLYFMGAGIQLWHDGALSYVGPIPSGTESSNLVVTSQFSASQARVSPDGLHLLFGTWEGQGLLGYNQGNRECESGLCRELYLYDAAASTPSDPDLVCVSCNLTGALPSGNATIGVHTLNGGAATTTHRGVALAEGPDGHLRAFFSTPDALLPADTNGKSDAYLYDASTEEAHLLSSGTAETDSWFMDASADGSNAFIITAQRLLGWDHDSSYDLYDVRTDGGFPEPPPIPAPCQGESCPGPQSPAPLPATVGSTLEGPGNPTPRSPTCPKGAKAKKVGGKTRCVKPKKHSKHHKRSKRANRGGAR